jgi:hypothetical protein
MLKKRTKIIELKRDKEVVFIVKFSPKRVEAMSRSKEWSVTFTNTTYEYGMFNYMVSVSDLDVLHEAVRAMYSSRMMLHDAKLLKEFDKELQRSVKRMSEAANKNRQDDIALAEEKVLHEKTEESINELEAIKKQKK